MTENMHYKQILYFWHSLNFLCNTIYAKGVVGRLAVRHLTIILDITVIMLQIILSHNSCSGIYRKVSNLKTNFLSVLGHKIL